ncbi:DinB family protein [Ilumatobacter sp.]|uniref:DinB family protein n=1 Tax=Ilumatobacter sp. TaxID=1967498 RepID=UPI003AF73522
MTAPDDWPYPDFDPAATADERSALTYFLADQRAAFVRKCAGLDAEQMARRSVAPSSMSLLGLVRHLAGVETGWFRNVLAGQDVSHPFTDPDDQDADFHAAAPDQAMVDEAWDVWRREVAFADEFVSGAPNLEVTGIEKWRGPMSLRWVLIHMIEEYAQHVGHADLLRERIDGQVTTDPLEEA